MVGLLLSCALSLPVSLDSVTEYIQCKDIENKIEHVQKWEPLVSKYFDSIDVPKALTIIYCESSGREYIVNDNTNGNKGHWPMAIQ